MSVSYTANGKFKFKTEASMDAAIVIMKQAGLISEHNGNFGLYADSEEFHAVDVIDTDGLQFVLAFGMYRNLLITMEKILPYCNEWELDFYSTETPEVGSWKNGEVKVVAGAEELLQLIGDGACESDVDAIEMTSEDFEEKYEEYDYYDVLENLLEDLCTRVWSQPNRLKQ
ncbi:MAG: hypothetical protein CL840_00515 [Crocinitomicaceae bacterium]|nr:hypothetical protein [Crocinitomicaceae bacterium]|tara:strand:- start:163986 stop:164498 length:513 start_codon:yes stop_codon:yes gene_type:complete